MWLNLCSAYHENKDDTKRVDHSPHLRSPNAVFLLTYPFEHANTACIFLIFCMGSVLQNRNHEVWYRTCTYPTQFIPVIYANFKDIHQLATILTLPDGFSVGVDRCQHKRSDCSYCCVFTFGQHCCRTTLCCRNTEKFLLRWLKFENDSKLSCLTNSEYWSLKFETQKIFLGFLSPITLIKQN